MKNQFVFWSFIIGYLLMPNFAFAQTLTLDEAINAALSNNPSIIAAGEETNAARARPPQAATPPDPSFMVQATQVPTDTSDINKGMIEYMVQQEIPFPTKLVYGHKEKRHEADAISHQRDSTEQTVVRDVKLAYFEAWGLQEEERINRQTLSIYDLNRSISEAAYASMQGPISDPVRATVDLGEIEARLAMIEQERIEKLAGLSSLISSNIEPATKISEPSRPPAVEPLEDLIERSKTQRPEIASAENMVSVGKDGLALARSQYGPDLTLRAGYMDMPDGFKNAWMGRIMLSVPLWSLSKQRFAVRESKAMLDRAYSLKKEVELNTIAEIRSSYARLISSKKIIDIYAGKVVPRARVLLSSSQEAYRSKKSDFLNIVDSIRSLNNAELMLVRAKVDEAKAYADLERAVGGNLKEGE
ncbi:MAG: hypothetical protein COV46_05245 [Deltaproteobacteria bacterium CG11_big_fil_rev_8_21_14_0_20_49_13]|nr:MAG: hypothetical protein COV46_05245 [Deltaproteobacteria bacterium CG11_big_fil_rev_8_21_14_0_20_49_13]